jgi:serine/threonine protein kinase
MNEKSNNINLNNISESKDIDKTEKYCMKEELSKDIDKTKNYCLKEELSKDIDKTKQIYSKEELSSKLKNVSEDIEILDCLNSGRRSNVYHISISSKNKNDKKDAIMKLLIDKRNLRGNDIKISEKLKNKNIICCYTHLFLDQGKSLFLIMEYAKYGNLRNFNEKVLKPTYFSESLICYLAYQILNGIKYMHICKVAHMNLKPQNIVIDEFLTAKIVDFSTSLIYKNKKPEDYIKLPFVGTNFYMSPEILKSDKIKVKDLNKVDLYSFGVILYNLAFAKYPYGLEKEDSLDYNIILEKIETNELTFPNTEDYSSYFLDFLSKLLEKDIEKRMSMSDALNNYWINGGRLLLDEQEKLFNDEKFLSYLLSDYISDFNTYIRKANKVKI